MVLLSSCTARFLLIRVIIYDPPAFYLSLIYDYVWYDMFFGGDLPNGLYKNFSLAPPFLEIILKRSEHSEHSLLEFFFPFPFFIF